MKNPLEKVWQFVLETSHTRTFALLALLLIVLAVPLTVYIAKQNQDNRQRASQPPATINNYSSIQSGQSCSSFPLKPDIDDPGNTPWGSCTLQSSQSGWTSPAGQGTSCLLPNSCATGNSIVNWSVSEVCDIETWTCVKDGTTTTYTVRTSGDPVQKVCYTGASTCSVASCVPNLPAECDPGGGGGGLTPSPLPGFCRSDADCPANSCQICSYWSACVSACDNNSTCNNGTCVPKPPSPTSDPCDYGGCVTPTKVPTKTPTKTPTATLTSTPTNRPSATLTATPTSSRSATISPSTTDSAGGAKLAFTLKLQGIGKNTNTDPNHPAARENPNPQTTTREIKVEVFDTQNAKKADAVGNVTYNEDTGLFTGTVSINNLQTGDYYVKVKSRKYLRRLIGKETNKEIQHITVGTTPNQMTQSTLIIGDTNDDNNLTIEDYNNFKNCFAARFKTASCTSEDTDLNDDGKVDLTDYAWLFFSFELQTGD